MAKKGFKKRFRNGLEVAKTAYNSFKTARND